ncbi:histidine phosphatase family protein [Streptosporangium sp. NPDC003464]
MAHAVTIATLGHLPSRDNRLGLRSRDQEVLPEALRRFRDGLGPALQILRSLAPVYRAVYCPTTLRHLTSARVVSDLFGIPAPVPDPRINNVDYGIHKGRPLEETPRRSAAVDGPYEGGTSWTHVAGQWRSFFEDRLRRHDGQAVLLAGQSGACPVMMAHICDDVPLAAALSDPRLDIPLLDARGPAPSVSVWTYRWR